MPEKDIWHMIVRSLDDFGHETITTRYTAYHPFKRIEDMDEESEGHVMHILMSWQKLSGEDMEVFNELGMEADIKEVIDYENEEGDNVGT
jgi:hypothetical protein